MVLIGSAPLSDVVLAEARRLFPRANIANAYGTTETGTGYFGAHPKGLARPPMSLGAAQPGFDIRLVGPAAPHEGVLELRGATQMRGYLNLPEITAAKIRDGWINTGDIMRVDADGWYYFVGRADDMFVCAGENIYPGEVERVLERHADVLEVCVVGVPDEVRGMIPAAFIVLRSGAKTDARALQDFVLANAAPHLRPRHVWFIDQMPLSGVNKIDRRHLEEEARHISLRT